MWIYLLPATGLVTIIAIAFLLNGSKKVISIDTVKNKGKRLYSKKYGLVSVPDFIEKDGFNSLIVREVKSRSAGLKDSDIAQLKVTILCVFETYKPKKITGVIEISDNKIVYNKVFYRKNSSQIYASIKDLVIIARRIKKGGKNLKLPCWCGRCKKK